MYLPVNGPRLGLRMFCPDDGARMYEIYGDEQVMRWVGHGAVGTRAQSDAMLDGYAEHQQMHGYSFWAVEETASGRVVGDAGLYRHDGAVELGYTLAADAWGQGYATEAARLCVDIAVTELRIPELIAVVRPENEASARVLTKVGFVHVGQKHDYGHPHDLYRLTHPHQRCGA